MDQFAWWDSPTASVIFVVGGLSLSGLSLIIRSVAPKYRGLIRVSLGNASIAVGYLAMVLFETLQPWLGVVAGNTLIVLGTSFVGNGLWAFLHKPARFEPYSYIPPVFTLVVLGALHSRGAAERIGPILVSVCLSIQFCISGLVLLYNYPYKKKSLSRFIAATFFLLSLMFLARVFLIFDPEGYFADSLATSHFVTLIGLTIGGTAWTFGLLLISATRLADELAAKEIDDNRRSMDLLMRTIIDLVPQSLVLKNRDSRYLMCNAAFAATVGKTAEELIGTTDRDHFPENLAEKYRSDDLAVMERGEPSGFYEEYQGNGRRLWVDTIKVPVRDQEGALSGVLVMFRDVTEQLAATRALEESEQRYRQLSLELEHRVEIRTRELMEARRDIDLFFEVTIEYLAIIDLEGRFLKTSPSWSKELGWREDELVGASFLAFVHPEEKDRMTGAMKFIASKVPLRDFHLRFRKADGAWIWLSVAAVGVEERQVIILAAHDITIQVEIEERLRLARREAERASRAKSQFIATMSHELRTPLNAVLGYAALLDQLVEDERGRGYLKSINTSGRSLLAIINDILDLTRAEVGRIELVPVPFEPRRLQEELGDIFRFSVEDKGLYLTVRVSERVPRTVMLDQARLRQVLVNLVGNAVKFTEAGGISVQVDAVPEGAPGNDDDERASRKCALKMEVTDTGIGITDEYRARLFDPFSQQDLGISRKYGGTGLGLAIAKRLLDLMGGTIRCDVPEAGGTRFRIEIPQVVSAGRGEESVLHIGTAKPLIPEGAVPASPAEDAPRRKDVRPKAFTVLLVDEEEESRLSLAEGLRRRGVETFGYSDCLSALENPARCDAAVVSIGRAPDEGNDICGKLLEVYGHIPLFALADTADRKTRLSLLRAGAVEVLRKPAEAEELALRLRNHLRVSGRSGDLADAGRTAHLESLVAKLDRMAMTDELTGLANRRYISSRMSDEIARCGQEGVPLAMIVGDMDRFKDVNDRYGHLAGDFVLAECGKRIAESLRDRDLVGRWGGEEFLALLPDTDLESAQRAAERIRFHLGNMPIIYGTESIQVTISLGVSAMVPFPQDDPDEAATLLIRAADDALYRSKGRGRNRVESLGAINPSGRPVPPSDGSSRL